MEGVSDSDCDWFGLPALWSLLPFTTDWSLHYASSYAVCSQQIKGRPIHPQVVSHVLHIGRVISKSRSLSTHAGKGTGGSSFGLPWESTFWSYGSRLSWLQKWEMEPFAEWESPRVVSARTLMWKVTVFPVWDPMSCDNSIIRWPWVRFLSVILMHKLRTPKKNAHSCEKNCTHDEHDEPGAW